MAAVAVLTVLTGCAAGTGSPDGWRYLRAGPVAVAHPKTWQEVRSGAVLHGAGGRTDGEITVTTDAGADAGAAPGAGADRNPAPPSAAEAAHAAALATARKDSLDFGGHRAEVLDYAEPAPDGRPAAHAEVRFQRPDGRAVVVRAWTADGATGWKVLRQIVNSIEFPPDRP